MARAALSAALVLAFGACAPEAESPATPVHEAVATNGLHAVAFSTDPHPIPFNEPFALDVAVTDAASGAPLPRADLSVTAWMPDHGHGMNRHPVATPLGGGRFRVEGLLFHMYGLWELRLDVVADGRSSRSVRPVELE